MNAAKRLAVRNLSIEFGGVHAVEDVSFDVEPGEIFAIIGPNGAGKSTIFNLISRLYEPTAGSIHYGDQDLLELPAHKIVHAGIGRTFQNIELFKAAVLADNHAMLELFAELDAERTSHETGTVYINVPVHRDATRYPDTPAGRAFRHVYRIIAEQPSTR